MKKSNIIFIFLMLLTCWAGCHKDKEMDVKEAVVSNEEITVSETQACFSWQVDFAGKFQTGVEVSPNEDMTDLRRVEATKEGDKFVAVIDSLTAGTKYFYRIVVWNKFGSFEEEVNDFTTSKAFTVHVSAEPLIGGTATGGGTFAEGDICRVVATANVGFNFVNWIENDEQVSTEPEYSFTVTGNRALVANFTSQEYTITATADPENGGTVSGSGGYNNGDECTLTATANEGYEFVNWTKNGTEVSTDFVYTFTVAEMATYVAHFQVQSYTITVAANPENGGVVEGGGTYEYGQNCIVRATEANGYHFVKWTENGNVVSLNANFTFMVTGNRDLEAHFIDESGYSIIAMDDYDSVCYLIPAEIPVLDNDIIFPDIQNATVQVLVQPTHGETYYLSSNHKIQYICFDNTFTGTDSFKYRVGFAAQNIWDEAWVFVNVGQPPTVGNIAAQGPICAGGALNIPTPSVNPSATGQWENSTSPNGTYQTFDPNNIPLSMNDNWVRYKAFNDCGQGISNAVLITVTNGPSFTGQTPQVSPICAGGSLNITAPAYNSNGSQILYQSWVASQTENGTYTTFNNNSLNNIPASYNGWYIRYMVEGSCGEVLSNPACQLTVNVAPSNVGTLVAPEAICAGDDLNVTAPTFDGTGTGSWEICQTPNGNYQPFNINNVPVTYNNWYLHYKVSNDCGSDASNAVQITVIDCSGTIPQGAINGKFTINGNGDKVYFSQGNLKYTDGTWSFHEHQYDFCFTTNGDVSSYYTENGTFDLFGWGTSGWSGSGATYYRPWDIDNNDGTLYGPIGQYNLTGTYADADWGVYNSIYQAGNQSNQWRTLTREEWIYVFNTRDTTTGKRYAKAKVNNVNGVILLPDDWIISYYTLNNTDQTNASFNSNVITTDDWNNFLEYHGAVFLPATGHRNRASVSGVDNTGCYWSASYFDNSGAFGVYFNDSDLSPQSHTGRFNGQSVRLIRPVEN